MRDILKVGSLLAGQRAAGIVISVVRAKVLAVLLDTGGLGLYAQANGLQQSTRALGDMGLAPSTATLIAEASAEDDRERSQRLLSTCLWLVWTSTLLLLAVTAVAREQLAAWVFADAEATNYVIYAVGSVCFVTPTLLNSAVLRGLLQFRHFVLDGVLRSASTAGVLCAFAAVWGVDGAILGLLVGAGLGLVLNLLILRSALRPRGLVARPSLLPHKATLIGLLAMIGPVGLATVFAVVAPLVVRSEVVSELGKEQNGLFQVSWGVSKNYLGMITGVVAVYGLPKVASVVQDRERRVGLQNDFARVALLLLAPGVLLLLTFRAWWIPLLYSASFLPAQEILLWQFLGTVVGTCTKSLNIVLIPLRRFRFLLLSEAGFWLAWGVPSLLLLERWGLLGLTVCYFAANALRFVVSAVYHHATTDFRFAPENWLLLGKTAALLGAGCGLAFTELGALGSLVAPSILAVVVMPALLPSREEQRQVWGAVRGRLRRS